MTILLVEQNFRFASRVADRFYLMEHGKMVAGFRSASCRTAWTQLHEVLGV
jgi:branched-chain amino acid transport system ATP-binding protein